MRGVLLAVAALAFGMASAAPAVAVPGDPMPGCETQVFANYCDGPIREDGSWKRCLFAHAQSTYGGGFVPPVQNCFIVPGVDQIPPLPLGQPPYHIE